MNPLRFFKPATPAILTCLLTSSIVSNTNAQHADALLIVNPEGNLVTGAYDFGNNTIVSTDQRVYEGEFDAFGVSDEPGFNALSSTSGLVPAGYSALPGNTPVTFTGKAFDIGIETSNLWHWDPVLSPSEVDFIPVTSPTKLNIKRSIFTSTLDGSPGDVAGFTIATTNATGFMHQHLSFEINDGDGDPLVQSAPEGYYLWSLELQVGDLATQPVYFVHGLGEHDEELHEAAIEWVESTLVPEPTAALLMVGAMGLVLRRNTRRTTV